MCSHLKDPVGGTVRIVYHVGRRSGFASYSCNVGYRLQGERLRNCVKGQWLGEKPVCSTKGKDLQNLYFLFLLIRTLSSMFTSI